MDRARIEAEWEIYSHNGSCTSRFGFAEHIAAIAREEALNDAENAIYLLEKDMKCVNAIRALKEQK
jgi:hypothetical protein